MKKDLYFKSIFRKSSFDFGAELESVSLAATAFWTEDGTNDIRDFCSLK